MKEYFPQVKGPIPYEGPQSKNPLAFKYYDAKRRVGKKTMEEHLRFAVAYWHTFKSTGADPFGSAVYKRPWNEGATPMECAKKTLDAAFEFFTKLTVPFWCFHDRDLAPEGANFVESVKNLEEMTALARARQEETGVRLLWGTSNLFSHPRYAHGAATNPDVHVFAYAAAQVKHAIAATKELGGVNYVFWGGREGYETILNTDMKRERAQLARFFHMAVDYAKSIGFTGQFLIEPKPKEPTKHQYDFDASTVISFLREFGLTDHFKLNLEANHATLAGHEFVHDLQTASHGGFLGSVDANAGDLLLGWDTDQFPMNPREAAQCLLVVLKQGGLAPGGFNFDAKVRRGSIDEIDLFHAHIGGMDTLARGLLVAQKIIEDGYFDDFVNGRYASYGAGLGKSVMEGGETFDSLEKWVLDHGEPAPKSGRQEMLENVFATYF